MPNPDQPKNSQAKLYAIQSYLEADEAIDFLEALTGCEITPVRLKNMAPEHGIRMWVDPSSLRGDE